MLEPFRDKNEIISSEPLKQNFLRELHYLLDKLKWYDVNVILFIYFSMQL